MADTVEAGGLKPGHTLADRFELRRPLGTGRAATVWLAFDRRDDYLVALKVLHDSSAAAALREEWQTLRSLRHSHIVRVFEFFDTQPTFYSMYFVDGAALSSFEPLPAAELLPALALVADALDFLHARDVVHGDVAPGNILFDQGGAPVLVDFGSAVRGERPVGLGATTPAYRAPDAETTPTPADDVFGFGAVLKACIADADAELGAVIAGLTADQAGQRAPLASLQAELGRREWHPARLPAIRIPARVDVAPEPLAVASPPLQKREALAPGASGTARQRAKTPTWVWASLGVLLLIAGYVAFFLEPPEPAGPAVTDAVEAAPRTDTAPEAPPKVEEIDEPVAFSEGGADDSMRTDAVRQKNATDRTLGQLLTLQEVLEKRGVKIWATTEYGRALAAYESGDRFYLAKDYAQAGAAYQRTIDIMEALLDRADDEFAQALAAADAALAGADGAQARRLYERALAITPGESRATRGLERATTLDDVLALMRAGEQAERDSDFAAAALAYEKALDTDPLWQAAETGLARVRQAIVDRDFRQLMSDGFFALDEGRLGSAERAFRAARQLKPGSAEPVDGLQQLDQTRRLGAINRNLDRATEAEQNEDWPAAITAYEAMLAEDDNLVQAKQGLANARARLALSQQLDRYLENPDALSEQKEIEAASALLLRIARITPQGPKLSSQKAELSRVLKRAAQPLTVDLVSDRLTEVAVYKVGRLGRFERKQLELRPGVYTVVGSRPGYKDVRLSVRVAPEIDMQPIVVRCEEAI